jgi:hypothetical protein
MIRSSSQRTASRSPLIAHRLVLLVPVLLSLALSHGPVPGKGETTSSISQAASDSCNLKIKNLENFAADSAAKQSQTTRFSQNEINSYLALDLSSKYSPGLKSLQLTFEESNNLQALALIDFDKLELSTTKPFAQLFANMFSGIHQLTLRGSLIAQAGEASFKVGDARFDGNALPGLLVEEIITTVGRRQNPPFDPLHPTQMPYHIEQVDVHSGYIIVRQWPPHSARTSP